jgi:glycosyl transferase family 25
MSAPVRIPVFWVNVDTRTDRRDHMEAQFAELGIAAERISAVTVAQVPADTAARVTRPEHFFKFTLGDLACGLSHQRIWRIMAERDLSEALVLEDDAVLSPEILPFLEPGLLVRLGADLLRLETRRQPVQLGHRLGAVGRCELHELLSTHRGTAGYIISRAAAEASLVCPNVNDMAVDRFLFGRFGPHLWRSRILQAVPGPVIQLDVLSVEPGAKAIALTGPGRSEISRFRVKRTRRRKLGDIVAYTLADLLPLLRLAVRSPAALFGARRPVPFIGDPPGG